MTSGESNSLHILHVTSAIGLVGAVFFACAGAPETRRKTLMWAGIASVVVLLTGIRMWQSLYGFHGGWAVVKLFCWLALSAITGIGYRKREQAGTFIVTAILLAAVAVAMVYIKPF